MGFLWTAETELKEISELVRGAGVRVCYDGNLPFCAERSSEMTPAHEEDFNHPRYLYELSDLQPGGRSR